MIRTCALLLPVLTGVWLILSLAGCSLFSTREPEPPLAAGGTFEQPDTPEQVVANVQRAVAEMNLSNYRRSLAPDLVYQPTASALARHGYWATWSRPDEEQYFGTLAAAARSTSTPQLAFFNDVVSIDREDRYVFDANYVLKVDHTRPEIPSEVQGHLIWVLSRGQDGLWSITEWTDQQLEGAASWSDLKAAFYL